MSGNAAATATLADLATQRSERAALSIFMLLAILLARDMALNEEWTRVAWVEAEANYVWAHSVPLPNAFVEEIGRLSPKVEVELETLAPGDLAAAALVEAPLYRKGEELKPWQRAFVGLFLEHRESYGAGRFLLADEVGVGKTLSLATAAMVSCLLGDGPALILAPATLCQQWQVELKDKLGLPSAVWLSNAKVWRDANGHVIKTRGAEDIRRCPVQIGIVSTGLIVQGAAEARALLECRFGTLVLDEGHKARKSRGSPRAGSRTGCWSSCSRRRRGQST